MVLRYQPIKYHRSTYVAAVVTKFLTIENRSHIHICNDSIVMLGERNYCLVFSKISHVDCLEIFIKIKLLYERPFVQRLNNNNLFK